MTVLQQERVHILEEAMSVSFKHNSNKAYYILGFLFVFHIGVILEQSNMLYQYQMDQPQFSICVTTMCGNISV